MNPEEEEYTPTIFAIMSQNSECKLINSFNLIKEEAYSNNNTPSFNSPSSPAKISVNFFKNILENEDDINCRFFDQSLSRSIQSKSDFKFYDINNIDEMEYFE